MAEKRNIGTEVLRGLRELKRGETGRTMNVVEDDDLYEIIDGERVALVHNAYGAWIVSRLAFPLANFTRAKQLGWSINHALFHMPAPINRDRRPDVAFVSYDRWAKDRPIPRTDNAWNVVPNLAVEVVSPTDSAEELELKVAEYFRAGVQLVWVVYPMQSKIHVYQAPTQIGVLTNADTLDGGSVVPGFRLALAGLFTETAVAI